MTAHEYGHHIQQLTGVMDKANRQGTGADSDSVRTELQADCYAGMWVGDATETLDPDTGKPFLDPITQEQLQNALGAASAVGDDHIQKRSGGGGEPRRLHARHQRPARALVHRRATSRAPWRPATRSRRSTL